MFKEAFSYFVKFRKETLFRVIMYELASRKYFSENAKNLICCQYDDVLILIIAML